jgi:membrane protein implicated in regulation of membrane protease activity
MLETTNPPLPPAPAPKGTNPWIIVIVVIVCLCCLCIGAAGLLLAFGEPILNELGSLHAALPGLVL